MRWGLILSARQHELDVLVARLRRQGTDDSGTEVKAAAGGLGRSIWDSVSAFANTAGGILLLGLADSTGFDPSVGFDADRAVHQFVDGIGDGGSAGVLLHPPAYAIHRMEIDGAAVVVIEIVENQAGTKPCTVRAKGIEGGSFKRVDDQDIRLSPTEIFEMQQALSPQESDREIVAEVETSDLDRRLLDALLAGRAHSRAFRGADTVEERLTRLNITSKAGGIRLAGLLAVGQYPQQFLPRLFIDVTVHPTNEKSTTESGVRFADRVACDGPLAEAIDQAVAAVARNLRTYSVVEGTARRDQLEIPV